MHFFLEAVFSPAMIPPFQGVDKFSSGQHAGAQMVPPARLVNPEWPITSSFFYILAFPGAQIGAPVAESGYRGGAAHS